MKIEDNLYTKNNIKTSLIQFMEDYGPVLGRDFGEYYAQKLRNIRGKQINRTIHRNAPAPMSLVQIFNDIRERIVRVMKNKPRRKALHSATVFEKHRMIYLHQIKTLLMVRDISAIIYTFHCKRRNEIEQHDLLLTYNRIQEQIVKDESKHKKYERMTRDLHHIALLPNLIPIPKDVINTCIKPYLC